MISHLVSLPEAVYPPHLALLVGVGQDAHGRLLPRDGQHKVLPVLLADVLPKLAEEPGGPLLLDLQLLGLKQEVFCFVTFGQTRCSMSSLCRPTFAMSYQFYCCISQK